MSYQEGGRHAQVTELASSFIVLKDSTILVIYSTYASDPMNSELAEAIQDASPTSMIPIPIFFPDQHGKLVRGYKWIVGWERGSNTNPPDYPLIIKDPLTRKQINVREMEDFNN